MFDMKNLPDHRPGMILVAQATRPIPLGSSGLWFDGSAIYYVAADGTQAALTTTATALVLDPNGSDITKVGGAGSAAGATRFGADAGHRTSSTQARSSRSTSRGSPHRARSQRPAPTSADTAAGCEVDDSMFVVALEDIPDRVVDCNHWVAIFHCRHPILDSVPELPRNANPPPVSLAAIQLKRRNAKGADERLTDAVAVARQYPFVERRSWIHRG